MTRTPWRTARRMYALHQGNNDWYRIRNQASGPTQLYIYDEIGYFGVTASDLIRDLADVTGPLEVHLNSPGGEVDDGIAIYNTLMERPNVTIRIDGLAASIASVIAMAGNPILIARQASMMVHDGHTMAIGNAQDLRDMAVRLDRASDNIASIYSEHTGKPLNYWRDIMKTETWYTGQEAIDAGLADRFIDSGAGRPVPPPSDTWDLANAFRGPRQQPHPTDGGPGTPPEPTEDQEVKIVFADGHTEIWMWDASAAMAKCHSASDYGKIAFPRTVGDPDNANHWALPHHSSPGSGPDRGGVIAALGRVNQTDNLANKSAAISHLHGHAADLGLPSGDNKAPSQPGWIEPTDEEMTVFLAALKGA